MSPTHHVLTQMNGKSLKTTIFFFCPQSFIATPDRIRQVCHTESFSALYPITFLCPFCLDAKWTEKIKADSIGPPRGRLSA